MPKRLSLPTQTRSDCQTCAMQTTPPTSTFCPVMARPFATAADQGPDLQLRLARQANHRPWPTDSQALLYSRAVSRVSGSDSARSVRKGNVPC